MTSAIPFSSPISPSPLLFFYIFYIYINLQTRSFGFENGNHQVSFIFDLFDRDVVSVEFTGSSFLVDIQLFLLFLLFLFLFLFFVFCFLFFVFCCFCFCFCLFLFLFVFVFVFVFF